MPISARTEVVGSVAVAAILAWFTFAALATQELWFLDGVNLIFHEAGHAILLLAPEFLTVLGGTLLQLTIPVTCTVYFYQRRQYLSAYVTLWWTGQNLIGVSRYLGDARVQVLPLLGDGHDWAYLLGRTGLLEQDTFIAGGIFAFGASVMIVAVFFLVQHTYSVWLTKH